MQCFVHILRWSGIILYSVLLVAFVKDHSLRNIALFLASFSFQSNTIGCIYLITNKNWIGCWAAPYLSFVAFVWFFFLGGKESTLEEWLFNVLLHYVQPVIVVLYWILVGKTTKIPVWLQVYPLIYTFCLFPLSWIIGYDLYPILKEYLFQLCCLLTFFYVLAGNRRFNCS
jgi:hypothetical protein